MALAAHTKEVFNSISLLECIKPYILVGGTALSLQIGTRLSEDLDFMSWKKSKSQKQEVDWVLIERELGSIGNIESREIWDFNHVEFILDGVKISFYASPNYSPIKTPVHFKNNLFMADILSIAAMKLELMLRRSNFRDYYDLYSMLKQGVNFKDAIDLALKYSQHALSTKSLLAILTDSSRYRIDSGFEQLEPIYKVSPNDIELYLKEYIKSEFKVNSKGKV